MEESLRIAIVSDLHLEMGEIDIAQPECDLVLVAGDVWQADPIRGVNWLARTFVGRPVIMVAGNHDLYGFSRKQAMDFLYSSAQGSNVTVLECDTSEHLIRGRKIRILGCTLWSDFAIKENVAECMRIAAHWMPDYAFIENEEGNGLITPAYTLRWHEESRRWLKNAISQPFDGQTVILSHHAPSQKSVWNKDVGASKTPAYASDLEELVMASQADLWVHGHVHNGSDYLIGQTRVVCHPGSYFEIATPDLQYVPKIIEL